MKQIFVILFIATFAFPCHAQWKGDWGPAILAFGVHDTSLFVSANTGINATHLVYRTTSAVPRTWIPADNGIDPTQGNVTSFASLGRYFFAGMTHSSGGNAGEYRSTDNGAHWNAPMIGSPVGVVGRYLFGQTGTSNGGPPWPVVIARSEDSGTIWDSVFTIGPFNNINTFCGVGAFVLAFAEKGIYRSFDTGSTWVKVTSAISNIKTCAVVGTTIYAINGTQLIKSTDSGTDWSTVTVDSASVPVHVNCLATDGKNLFAGTPTGILVSTDTGHSWTSQNDGMRSEQIFSGSPHVPANVSALYVFDTLLFAEVYYSYGNYNYWLFDRPIRELTGPSDAVAEAPPLGDTIEIYPNPTTSQVSIRSGGTAILGVTVLNVLGENMLSIPNSHSSDISLDLSKLPSGTYFLQIETENGIVLRKVIRE